MIIFVFEVMYAYCICMVVMLYDGVYYAFPCSAFSDVSHADNFKMARLRVMNLL